MTGGSTEAAPAATLRDTLELPPVQGKDLRHPLLWLSAATVLAAILRIHLATRSFVGACLSAETSGGVKTSEAS